MNKLIAAAFAIVAVSFCISAVDALDCVERNASCSQCVSQFECYWCGANVKPPSNETKSPCQKRKVWQLTADCSSSYHLYPSCAISGLAVMIIVIVVCVLFIVMITTCICCCCCCSNKRSKKKWLKEDERERREREERKSRQEGRKVERKERSDEIRKKYGLYKEGDGGGTEGRYQRFDV